MRAAQLGVIPGLVFLVAAACDQGGQVTEDDTGTDADAAPDVTEDTVEETVPDAAEDPEPETVVEPAAPFAVVELFTSEG